jgi:hypothetical protein
MLSLPRSVAHGLRKNFFFEKKQQKTFGRFDFGTAGDAQSGQSKVFWFFFSKKNCFLPLAFAWAF